MYGYDGKKEKKKKDARTSKFLFGHDTHVYKIIEPTIAKIYTIQTIEWGIARKKWNRKR